MILLQGTHSVVIVVSARALFQDENYSLFNCRIPWQFHSNLPVVVEDIISSSPIITRIPVPFGGGWMAAGVTYLIIFQDV